MRISKNLWGFLLVIIAILIIILIVTNLNKNKGQENVQNGGNNASGTTAEDVTQAKQGEVEVTEVNITSDGTMTNVTAQVTNNDTKTYSMVDISVVFYGEDNSVLSTAKGLIENLAVGDKKGFSSTISGDFSKSSKYEVKIEKAE